LDDRVALTDSYARQTSTPPGQMLDGVDAFGSAPHGCGK
jgi:hypothetical protein